MGKVWVENKASGPRVIGGVLLQPGEGAFVEDGGAQEVSTPSVPLLVNPVTGKFSDSRLQSLVSGAGQVRTLKKVRALEQSILTQLDSGEFVLVARLPEQVGMYGAQVALATGPLSALLPTGQVATLTSSLKTSTGATITNGLITGAWALPDGNLLFSVTSNAGATSGKGYLYYAKRAAGSITANTLTVGNNAAAFDNGNAVLDIGSKGGTHPTNIRILHSRSVCIAKIGGNWVLFINEYNVAYGRVPGSTNDQVRVLRSNDLGLTWSVFLEFNTNGVSSQVRHGHGVVQDPATGYVYFLFGDDPTSGIIRWDGAAATPPANTPLPDFNKYAGWHALARLDGFTDYYRTGDIVFGGDVGAYLTDRANSETFWNATAVSRYGAMASTRGAKADLSAVRDPLIGLAIPGGGAIWLSMWDTSLNGATRGFDVWSSPDLRSWTKIGYIPDVGPGGTVGVLFNVFWADNEIVVSLVSGSAALIESSNDVGGSLVFTADEYFDGTPKALA
ncbi:hypothetical protein [Paucibacter sp. B51]|uniref:hypothetical protein n=1 Tax=Paucibacter sp. B51 TaxID=2993315 RepID=UPI0022EC1602|nr:hypothetical protein [Paucibacter sp. B51]